DLLHPLAPARAPRAPGRYAPRAALGARGGPVVAVRSPPDALPDVHRPARPPEGALSEAVKTVLRPIVKLAVPLAAAQAGQSVISLTDTAIVGRTSAADLAGVALGNSIFFTVFVLC